MDGVLWRGETALPGLNNFFALLRQEHIGFILATNNSSKTQAQYVQKLAKFGVKVSPEEILTSALATAEYLKADYPPNSTFFVIGQDGIREAIISRGFNIGVENVAAVVVGLDFNLTYDALKQATLLINKGAAFIGTNPDLTYPVEDNFAPGNGAILAALTAATGKEPKIIGKPNQAMFEVALKQMQASPNSTAMLGDRLETDILGGQQVGLKTILVLSGITQKEDLKTSSIKADWVFDNLEDLLESLN